VCQKSLNSIDAFNCYKQKCMSVNLAHSICTMDQSHVTTRRPMFRHVRQVAAPAAKLLSTIAGLFSVCPFICDCYWNSKSTFLLTLNFFLCQLLSPFCLSVVCLYVYRLLRSCTLLSRLKFSAIFLHHLVPWPSVDIHGKFYGDRPRGTLPRGGGLNARGVSKYSNF